MGNLKTDPIANEVAERIKTAKGSLEVVTELVAKHGHERVRTVLLQCLKDAEDQITDRAAKFAEFRASPRERAEYLKYEAEHARWRAGVQHYKHTLDVAFVHLKSMRTAPVDWQVDERVLSALPGSHVYGRVVVVHGDQVVVEWERSPGVPYTYVKPWKTDVIRLVKKDGAK